MCGSFGGNFRDGKYLAILGIYRTAELQAFKQTGGK
jgi:hypothetical protein